MASRRRPKGPPFIQLFRWVTQTVAWQMLSPAERCLYLELRSRYNGHNNGFIGLGCREAAAAINVGRDTANRAFLRLEELGFIQASVKGAYRTNGRRATDWLLTELPDDRTGHKAQKTFASWSPDRKNPSPISRPVSPTSRTQTEKRIDELTLRPISRMQTARKANSASDLKDTYRSTTSPRRLGRAS